MFLLRRLLKRGMLVVFFDMGKFDVDLKLTFFIELNLIVCFLQFNPILH